MTCISCSTGLLNSGLLKGYKEEDYAVKLIIVRRIADDGTLNRIADDETLDADFFNGLLNNADKSKRWYPLPRIENVVDERAESIFESFTSGNKRLRDRGNRTFTAELLGDISAPPASYINVLNAMNCEDLGFYYVDNCGNLIGNTTDAGFLSPIPIMKKSFDIRHAKATREVSSKIMVNFEYDLSFDDSKYGMFYCDEITGIDLRTIEGLINLILASSTLGAADAFVDATIKTDYGSVSGGLLVGNLATKIGAFLVADDTEITMDTVVETSTGIYRLTPSSAFAADFYIGVKSTVNGFDDTLLKTTITV